MASNLVDFHCHLDLYQDHAEAIAECERAQIYTLTVTTTPQAWPRNKALTSKTKFVRPALGIHPQLVEERANEVVLWESYLDEARYIGEVGLDAGPRFYKSLPEQERVFERVLRSCAEAGGKILSVHSVRATTKVLDLVQAHLPRERGRVVLHWFTGTRSDAERALALGCLFSVNLEMLQRPQHRKWLADVPLESLLTETDGPFTKRGDRVTQPGDVARVVDEIALLRGIDRESAKTHIIQNLRELLTP